MKKKADPGMLGSPVQGIWPQSNDPPLYIPGRDRAHRGSAWFFSDFWNFPQDNMEHDEDRVYPEPNAWRRTRAPFALGNIPSIEEIEYNSEDLVSPWRGSPRSPWYHGNDFMIDGPYGDSNDALSDDFFFNNMVPVTKYYKNLPIEKMLRDYNKKWYDYYNKMNYLNRLRKKPTLPTKQKNQSPTLWDFMGEPIGPNTTYYGVEPSTGGGGVGLMAGGESGIKKSADNSAQEIGDLIDRIKKHRDSLDFNQVLNDVNSLVYISEDFDRKILFLSKKLRFFIKMLKFLTDKDAQQKIKKNIIDIIEDINESFCLCHSGNKKKNWYEIFKINDDKREKRKLHGG